MITDVLFKRYPERWLLGSGVPAELVTLIRQAALVMHQDVAPSFPDRDALFMGAHKRLARELGAMELAPGHTSEEKCMHFLGELYDLWNDAHGDADRFLKRQLSLIELLFREAENRLRSTAPNGDIQRWFSLLQKRTAPKGRSSQEAALEALINGIEELNHRFKEAKLPFGYHNGIIQRIDDALTSVQIEAPFWSLVAAPKWRNVDSDMKEAVDRRDGGKGDAAFYALKALESSIKILSDDLNRTRATEKGAADYIDNLVAANPQRFIEVWESNVLKCLFRDLRNPQGHGAGSAAPLVLTPHQSTYVIEAAMAWVKSLVRRLP